MNRWRGLPRKRRDFIVTRDGPVCRYCGRVLDPFADHESNDTITIDHVVPRSEGGVNRAENLVVCCRPCNEKKAGRSLWKARMRLIQIDEGVAS